MNCLTTGLLLKRIISLIFSILGMENGLLNQDNDVMSITFFNLRLLRWTFSTKSWNNPFRCRTKEETHEWLCMFIFAGSWEREQWQKRYGVTFTRLHKCRHTHTQWHKFNYRKRKVWQPCGVLTDARRKQAWLLTRYNEVEWGSLTIGGNSKYKILGQGGWI